MNGNSIQVLNTNNFVLETIILLLIFIIIIEVKTFTSTLSKYLNGFVNPDYRSSHFEYRNDQ